MPWGDPVDVEIYVVGKYRIITSTAGAAECLLESWPENAIGKEYRSALRACLADLEGKRSSPRAAFIKAANAAGMTIRPSSYL
ncbi:DUF982 domain-containing protein [Brucella haematophila]|uniref:DUF982 domain-containing protein n=1 Tax=Brucella haematophila TaxID=419474 RepID=A0ABX1DPN8_9HYPH|nr:DUF982 domain-containing protein [Brucella haematophila]NKC04433.1 DUF982 domain-containing protein [Brucella haematophila]TMU86558.1 DUF982 domain-containing protein [Brucella haematophila]